MSKPDIKEISLEDMVNACTSNIRPGEEEAHEIELDQLMNNALDIFSMPSEIKQRKGKGACF